MNADLRQEPRPRSYSFLGDPTRTVTSAVRDFPPSSTARVERVWIPVSRYIVYDAEQTRRIALNVSVAFLILTLFLNSYSLQGPLAVSRFLAVLFLGAGLVVCQVLAGMERHPILSKISRTKPGELNREFWAQLIALGGLPFLGVLAHLFPSISRFLFSWVAPSVEAIH